MSSRIAHEICYDETVYAASCTTDLKELGVVEDWNERPASDWAVQRIGLLQSKIEKYKYSIYHGNRYGKHDLSRLMPGYVVRQFANESFGYNGWQMEILHLEATESHGQAVSRNEGEFRFSILAEAAVKISLKDGTNTRASGVGCATMPSRGESYGKAKKEAVNDAFKKALLSFERIIIEHECRIQNKYYVDGQYASRLKK